MLAPVPIAVDVDIRIRRLDLDRHEQWRGLIGNHARPEFARLDTERGLLGVLEPEFDIGLAANLARIRRHIDWLRENLEMIP